MKEILSDIVEGSYRFKTDTSTGETVFYETSRLYQRVLLAIGAAFIVNPLVRIQVLTPIVFFIGVYYFVVQPYKPEMYILHWMEVFSVLGISVRHTDNVFRGVLNVYEINYEYPVSFVWKLFTILDLIFSPICVIIYFFIMKTIYNKTKCKIKSIYYALKRCGSSV